MNNILLAVILTSSVALLAGVLLVLADLFMPVDGDKEIEKILKILPGANCGACGFSGCSGYARAITEGLAEPNLCAPGGSLVSEQISKFLGVDVKDVTPKTAFVKCRGNSANTQEDKIYQGLGGCAAVSKLYGGNFACSYACLGLGDCADVCDYSAISICQNLAFVDSEKCKACGKCVEVCPKNLISLVEQKTQAIVNCSNCDKGPLANKVCKVSCIGCGKCAKICKQEAITIKDFLANIDSEKCSACGECTTVCPKGCITIINKN